MMQNELEGEQIYKPKSLPHKEKIPSRGSQQNTESDNDMPDIDEDGPPRVNLNGGQHQAPLGSDRGENSHGQNRPVPASVRMS
jgi:hypothetical protein